MDGRTRNQRGAAPASTAPQTRGTARQTRQAAATTNPRMAATSPVTRGSRQKEPAQRAASIPRSGSLVLDPVPRRNAPLHRPPRSVNSVTTRGDDDESSGREDDAADEYEDADEKARWLIMAFALPDLHKASQELISRLGKPESEKAVFNGLLKLKKKTFNSVLETFQGNSPPSPLLDLVYMSGRLGQVEDVATYHAKIVLAGANLATILESVQSIQSGGDPNIFAMLRHINAGFPMLFATAEASDNDLEMTLDVRTSFFVDSLAMQHSSIDLVEVIASVFCEPSDGSDAASLIKDGPFRSLGGHDKQAEAGLCAERIADIVSAAKSKKASQACIKRLRDAYPLEDFLVKLGAWVLRTNEEHINMSRQLAAIRRTPDAEEYHDAEEEPDDEAGSLAESQPIQRLGGDAVGSLFGSRDDLEALEIPQVPTDYVHHSSRDLLMGNPLSQVSQLANSQIRVAKRGRETENENDDNDDADNAFQTDERSVPEDRRATIKAEAIRRAAKQPRTDAGQVPPPSSSAQSSMPPPPRPSSTPAPRDPSVLQSSQELSSQTDDNTIHRTHIAHFEPPRLRHPWSDHDYKLLKELVGIHHASWSVIEEKEGKRFDRIRNQQAFRDKARNMKVDFLITDAILPPGFDLVALGKKEITKLMGLGKNPNRKEHELDDDGKATNTEYMSPGELANMVRS